MGAMNSSQEAAVKDMGVICSLAEHPDGSLRVILDDAARMNGEPGRWAYKNLFTFKDYPAGELNDLAALSQAELADFGFNVLLRLLASNGLIR